MVKEKILIIDDDDLLREGIRTELISEGFEVFDASNGRNGFEIAKRQLPDLILSDVNMPELDGYETLKLIRSEETTSTIPIILMTGVMKDYPHVRQGMNIGAEDYIAKPFTIPDLLAAIRSILSKKNKLIKQVESKYEELRLNIAQSLPHELRTPLGVIMGFSEILQTGFEKMERDEIGVIARMMQAASQRLQKLIEAYIDYSKIELFAKDEAVLIRARQETTKNIHLLLKTLAEQKAKENDRVKDLVFELQPASAKISSEHFTKIIKNILDNSFKFSKPGTSVIIKCLEKDKLCNISICDSGCGLSPEQISQIGGYMQFDRKSHEQQGLGLGLIVAKRLTEVYEGILTVESQQNQGTIVSIRLVLPQNIQENID
jgi:two-component system, sensor histidine kinase and response regulator